MRLYDYSPQQAIPAGAGVTTIPYQALRGSQIVGFNFVFAGAVVPATMIDRIRILLNQNVWHDVAPAAFFNWANAYLGPRDMTLGSANFFPFPFFDVFAPTVDEADMCQLPRGNPEIQITFNATMIASAVNVGIVMTTIMPAFTSRLYGSAMNIQASQANASYTFGAAGTVRAAAWPLTGVQRQVLTLGGLEVIKATGPSFTPALDNAQLIDFWDTLAPAANTPKWYRLGDQLTAPLQASSILLDTGAGWAGVQNELTLYMMQAFEEV